MRKIQKHILTTLIASLFIGQAASAEELLINPGFEAPVKLRDNSGWDARGPRQLKLIQVNEPVAEGTYALLVDGRGDQRWQGVKQIVHLKPGKTYRLSGAIRLGKGEGSGQGVVQLIKELKNGKKVYQNIFRSRLSSGEFTTFEKDFSFSEKNISAMSISIHGLKDGKSFIVDNFSLTEVE